MGIQSAMFSGISGLNLNSQAMSVIGNNLANSGTLGYKSARSVFSDLLSSNVFGSGGVSQVGRGAGLSIVDSVFSQGTFETTSSGTDVAVEGVGFFVLKEPGNDTTYYSRAGSFRFDQAGYLVSPEGLRVQGKAFDQVNNTELLPIDPSDIRVNNLGLVEANPTTEVTFNTNLSENSTEIGPGNIDPADRSSYNYSASTKVYDSLGESHLVTAYWRLVDDTNNTWEAAYRVDNENGIHPLGFNYTNFSGSLSGSQDQMEFDSKGQSLNRDGNGAPIPFTSVPIPIQWGNGALDSTITFNFDCTQYNSDSIVISQSQNGYGAGELTNVAVNNEGIVVASYSNGRQINISQLVLAKFQNPGGLQLAGANRYTAPSEVGIVRIGLPGPELGKLYTNSLEQSNVDMGQEFVSMITTQRGFQANSKIITTVDEMLSELINLKR
ncbi:MAG: flagellar hook protein FlgE [Desulfobulbus sp.]|jgi:flagellar hook protein FlgE|uniref:flagellar hook protein FlgE n=1 Tax=Desulfobulbus sp. TaxID=895 RepID=UPI00283F87FF|nr:flagellar hook protein FlgE [Desulfobulbus sp.]MDR2550764.1 flagellar hook protein FlgE [Desulfobulbus sp.]